MKRSPRTPLPARIAGILLAVLLTTPAWAASPVIGVAITPITGGIPALNASAFLPLTTFDSDNGPVSIGPRADLTAAFDVTALPAIGLLAIAEIESDDSGTSWVGTGASLAWRSLDGQATSFITWTAVAGVRIPINDLFNVRIEASGAPAVAGFALMIGVDLTPWK